MRDNVLAAKTSLIEEIKEKIENAESLVLVDYRGLNVEQINELRTAYRNEGVEYKVYKNTMMRFAFKDLGYDEMIEFLAGPSAVAFGMEDPVAAAKVTQKYVKETEKLVIKSGIVDGKVISVEEVEALAKLPSKEELVAKALGSLNSPIQGLATVLNGTVRGLAIALNAIAEKKEEEEQTA